MDACEIISTDYMCGYISKGHRADPIVKTVTSITEIQCLRVCQLEQCRSYNYQTNNKTCELVNVEKATVTKDHVYDHVDINEVRFRSPRWMTSPSTHFIFIKPTKFTGYI